jgi:hypothetical protein
VEGEYLSANLIITLFSPENIFLTGETPVLLVNNCPLKVGQASRLTSFHPPL